jgi:hypothetical protein
MPTPDASQYIQKRKFQAIQDRKITGGPKLNTHLYAYVPPVTMLRDFLPSFTNKFVHGPRYTRFNLPGVQVKHGVPSRGI